jgi:hypothetical protein
MALQGFFFVILPPEECEERRDEQSSYSTPPGLINYVMFLTTDVTVAIGF